MSTSLASLIPDDWPRWSATQPAMIEPLLGGLTNQSYLINADHEQLVLRINSAISQALNLNRSAEADALALADTAGLCAPLVHYDPQQQYMVSRYLGGDTWSADSPASLQQLAELIRRIHQLPCIEAHLNIEEKIAYYWRAIDGQAKFADELGSLDSKIRDHITSAKALNKGNVLCHNDLLVSNLIVETDGSLYAIDWEYAAMSDPFYELAVIIEGNGLNSAQQQLLLTNYLARSTKQDDWQRLHHWKIIYGYLSLLWYGVQYSGGTMGKSSTGKAIANQICGLKALIAKDATELST